MCDQENSRDDAHLYDSVSGAESSSVTSQYTVLMCPIQIIYTYNHMPTATHTDNNQEKHTSTLSEIVAGSICLGRSNSQYTSNEIEERTGGGTSF